ncbi:MAG: GNAT family N-acetyltransferase [Mariniblastus sp.]|nr:GNAT family N-acetyltransferase [Mariniblastus sp.]
MKPGPGGSSDSAERKSTNMQPPPRLINAADAMQTVEPSQLDGRHSFGPFAAVSGQGYLLDCTSRPGKPLLGFNASPLFGTAHHQGAWSTNYPADDGRLLKTGLLELGNRCQSNLVNRLDNRRLDQIAMAINQTDAALGQISRTYITLSVLDQYPDQLDSISNSTRQPLQRLENQFPDLISGSRTEGMRFELQFQNSDCLDRFYSHRFDFGLDFDSNRNQLAQFELVLACRDQEMEILWRQLEALLHRTRGGTPGVLETVITQPVSMEQNYKFAEFMIASRLPSVAKRQGETATQTTVAYLESCLANRQDSTQLIPVILNRDSYTDYREQILALQTEVYEPARQSSAEEFDAIFQSADPVALLLLAEGRIAGMGLAGPIAQFPEVRGISTDPYRSDPNTLYMVDVTVREEYRGGIGKLIKQAITLLAQQHGFQAIHGRNRDRLARGMWSINLSLGSFELQHLVDDYPDQGEFRDCIYYRCPLAGPVESLPGGGSTDLAVMLRRLPGIINGI